jgi:hypothetical protein
LLIKELEFMEQSFFKTTLDIVIAKNRTLKRINLSKNQMKPIDLLKL